MALPWRRLGFRGTPWGVPWHAMCCTMAAPAATTTALHGNPTACQGNPHGTPMPTAPRVRVRVPWYAVKVRGRFRGILWKVLSQVVPRPCHGISRKISSIYIPRVLAKGRDLGCGFTGLQGTRRFGSTAFRAEGYPVFRSGQEQTAVYGVGPSCQGVVVQ